MDGWAVYKIMKDLEDIRKRLNLIEEQLELLTAREQRLQKEEEYNKKYSYGWGYLDESKTEI